MVGKKGLFELKKCTVSGFKTPIWQMAPVSRIHPPPPSVTCPPTPRRYFSGVGGGCMKFGPAWKGPHGRKPRKTLEAHFWRGFFILGGRILALLFFIRDRAKIRRGKKDVPHHSQPPKRAFTCISLAAPRWSQPEAESPKSPSRCGPESALSIRGNRNYSTVGAFSLTVSFFAYSPLRPSLDAL